MTKTQTKDKIRGITKNIRKEIEKLMEKTLKTGAVDIAQYEDNYRLPKIIVSAILKELTRQYRPLTKEDQAESENIYRFL